MTQWVEEETRHRSRDEPARFVFNIFKKDLRYQKWNMNAYLEKWLWNSGSRTGWRKSRLKKYKNRRRNYNKTKYVDITAFFYSRHWIAMKEFKWVKEKIWLFHKGACWSTTYMV